MTIDWEARFEAALREIAAYMTPEQHHRHAEKRYGLDPHESMEMALDNIIGTAKATLKGYRRRKPPLPSAPRAQGESRCD